MDRSSFSFECTNTNGAVRTKHVNKHGHKNKSVSYYLKLYIHTDVDMSCKFHFFSNSMNIDVYV